VSSWLLYGFGELVDKTCEIEKNTFNINKTIQATNTVANEAKKNENVNTPTEQEKKKGESVIMPTEQEGENVSPASQAYGIYYNRAVEDLLGVDLENKNLLFAEAFDPEELALIAAACGEIKADVDASGRAISGSRKEKVIKYVESLKLRAAQKYMIMGYLGYRNTTGRQVVFSYIESLRISKAKKEALFEMSGCKLK